MTEAIPIIEFVTLGAETPVEKRSDVNVPLLRKTLDWAYGEWQKARRGEISEWNQEDWMLPTEAVMPFDEDEVIAAVQQGLACGTSCCIAGKVAFDDGWRTRVPWGSSWLVHPAAPGAEYPAREVGADLLGLTDSQAHELFSGNNKIHDLYRIAARITDGEITVPAELADGLQS